MRRLLYLVTLSLVATLVFVPAALAQVPRLTKAQIEAAAAAGGPATCYGFEPGKSGAQMYFLFKATPEERAILDADGDGIACSSAADFATAPTATQYAEEGDGGGSQESGQDDPCLGAKENLVGEEGFTENFLELHLHFFPEVGGCAIANGASPHPMLDFLRGSVYDPDTGEKLGLVKDLLNPDLTSGANFVTYEKLCGGFPTPENERDPLGGLSAQQYYEQNANAKEQAILDPDGDGLACTSEDEAFLAGDAGQDGDGGGEQTAGDPTAGEQTGGETTGSDPTGTTDQNGGTPGGSGAGGGGGNGAGGSANGAGGNGGGGNAVQGGNGGGNAAQGDPGSQGGISGAVANAVGNIGRGRLPDTGGGWAVLLVAAAVLISGGWLLVRSFSR